MHELLECWSLVGSVVPALLHGGEQSIWAAIFDFAEIGAAFCVAHKAKSGSQTLSSTCKLGKQSKHNSRRTWLNARTTSGRAALAQANYTWSLSPRK